MQSYTNWVCHSCAAVSIVSIVSNKKLTFVKLNLNGFAPFCCAQSIERAAQMRGSALAGVLPPPPLDTWWSWGGGHPRIQHPWSISAERRPNTMLLSGDTNVGIAGLGLLALAFTCWGRLMYRSVFLKFRCAFQNLLTNYEYLPNDIIQLHRLRVSAALIEQWETC